MRSGRGRSRSTAVRPAGGAAGRAPPGACAVSAPRPFPGAARPRRSCGAAGSRERRARSLGSAGSRERRARSLGPAGSRERRARSLGPAGSRERRARHWARRGPGRDGRGHWARRGPGRDGRGHWARRGPGRDGRGHWARRGPGRDGRGHWARRGPGRDGRGHWARREPDSAARPGARGWLPAELPGPPGRSRLQRALAESFGCVRRGRGAAELGPGQCGLSQLGAGPGCASQPREEKGAGRCRGTASLRKGSPSASAGVRLQRSGAARRCCPEPGSRRGWGSRSRRVIPVKFGTPGKGFPSVPVSGAAVPCAETLPGQPGSARLGPRSQAGRGRWGLRPRHGRERRQSLCTGPGPGLPRGSF
ncbi:spidroin-2-like [Passer domesticus]|uniref:spidroin-2-like n=1 Tax=Passer domesticus TaxID=48849 RepID=UPI0030FE110A